MSDSLAPLFTDRKTRLTALPDEQRLAFESLEKNSPDPDFGDRQFSALWMSKRTGLPQEEVLQNFDALASRYFGEGATAAKAYDTISGLYKPKPTAGQGEGGENAPKAEESPLMVGGTVIAKDVAGSFAGGASRMGYDTLGGFYSNLASLTGVTLKRPKDDGEYQSLTEEMHSYDTPEASAVVQPVRAGPVQTMGFTRQRTPEEFKRLFGADSTALTTRTAEIQARMKEIEATVQAENMAALEAASEFRKDYSANSRKIATTMYELSRESIPAFGVRAEFQETAFGQFVASAGSVPATALFATMGPVFGGGATYAGIFGQAEQERMEIEGEAYDPQSAYLATAASAGPQAVMEFAFGMERILGAVLKTTPRVGGRIAFGDAVRNMGKAALMAGAEEAITEPAQNQWNDWVASISYDESRELLTDDVLKQRLVESVSAFALGAFFGGAVQGVDVVDRNRTTAKAEHYLMTRQGQPFEPVDFAALRTAKTDEEIRAMSGDPSMADTLLAAANGDQQAQANYRQDTLRKAFVNTDGLQAQGFSIGNVGEFPAVMGSDGRVATIDMQDPAQVGFLREVQGEAIAAKEATEATLAQAQSRFGESLEITQAVESQTLRQLIDDGQITEDQGNEALEAAKSINGLAKAATLSTAKVGGHAGVKVDSQGVARMAIRIAQGADPTVAVEEVAESWYRKAVVDGKLDPAELSAARKQWNTDNNEAEQAGGTSERADIEWFSKRVIDYALANRKTELPGGWSKWLRTLGERLKAVLAGAAKMKKLMRDGKLDPKLEGWFQSALGIGQAEQSAQAFQNLTPAEQQQEAGDRLRQSPAGGQELRGELGEQQKREDAERIKNAEKALDLGQTFSLEDVTFAVTGIPQTKQQRLQRQFNQIVAKQAALFPYPYHQLAALPIQAKVSAGGHEAGLVGKLLLPVSERLRYIADKAGKRIGILSRARRYFFEKGDLLRSYSDQVKPLMRGLAGMTAQDLRLFGVSASNQEAMTRDAVIAKYGLQNEWAAYEQARDDLRAQMIAAGMDVGDIGEYFPRWVKNVTGLRQSLGVNADDGVLSQAVIDAEKKAGRPLRPDEVNAVIDGAVRGVNYGVTGGSAPSNTKQRKITVIQPTQWTYYADPNDALSHWLNQSTEAIARYRFFGKDAKTLSYQQIMSPTASDLDASIGAILREEVESGNLPATAQAEVNAMLDGLFSYHGRTNAFIRGFMDLSYWATMGKLSSALAQATDLMVSVYEAGPWNTFMAIPEAMWRNAKSLPGIGNSKTLSEAIANFTKGKDWLTREQLGIDRIMQEFDDQRFTTRALNQVFTATGLNFMDGIGKDVLLNAKFRQLTQQAKKGQLSRSNQEMIEGIFGKAKAAQVIADFRAGTKSKDAIFAVYNVLADWQPISLLEYPEAYAKNPNARVLYMLKSYSIKMLSAYRREGFMKMWWGSPAQKIEGARNISYLLAMLFAAGVTKDWLTDFLLDRDPQMEDITADNLFKLMQVSRYAVWNQRNRATDEGIYGGVGAVAKTLQNVKQIGLDLIAPPFTLVERPMKDVAAWAKAEASGEPWTFWESESVQFIPIAGEFLYWTGPTGQKKIERRRALREREDR